MAEHFKDQNVQTVMGPMTGGILLAHEVGKALGTRAILQNVKRCDDVASRLPYRTGGTCPHRRRYCHDRWLCKEVVDVVKQAGGEIVGVGLLVDRSGGKAEFGIPKDKVHALLHLTVPTYKPEECPLCKKALP